MTDWTSWIAKIAEAANEADIAQLELQLLGRKQGLLTAALKELGTMSPEERKKAGEDLNASKQKIEEAIAERRSALKMGSLSDLATKERMDLSIDLPAKQQGHLHPIPEFMRRAEEVFGEMGFDVAQGPEVETEEKTFDLLNFPKEHPARDNMDTFWITDDSVPAEHKAGDRWLLRCHTSPVQVRYMQRTKPPFRMICPGKVYRKDSDATHSPMFHQIEGLMIGPDISLANMKAVMSTGIRALIGSDVEFRFRSSFFPFVEPGLEVDMKFKGSERWLEVAGCGMVHPNVLTGVGIDPKKWQGFAFGFGVERLIMIKEGITDLRGFYTGDLRFLEQF